MTIVVANVGEAKYLENMVNKTAPQNLVLRLFCNDYTPVAGSVAANFTEAAGGGYVAKTLTGANWNNAVPGDPSYITHPEQIFVFSGPLSVNANVYGYYIVGATDGVLRHAERFTDGPYTPTTDGDQIKVTPRLEGQSAP